MTKLESLVQRFRRESGFEVYVQAGEREHELNDGIMRWEGHVHYNVYVRAVHNLKRKYIGSDSSALVFGTIPIKHIPEQDRVNIEVPTALKFKDVNEANPDFSYYPPIHLLMLGKESTVSDIGYKERTFVERKKEPREGLLRHIFPYKTVPIEVKKPVQVPIERKVYAPFKLSEITETGIDKPAYVMTFQFPVVVYDSGGIRTAGYPEIRIITIKDVIEQAANFLLMYPELYEAFIRGVIPREKFPNVNKNILDLPHRERKGIIISNSTTGEILRADAKRSI